MKCLLFIKICMHKSISNKASKRPTNQYGRFKTAKLIPWMFRPRYQKRPGIIPSKYNQLLVTHF